jgi:uncharacterized phage protein (predicted DNA packaging)
MKISQTTLNDVKDYCGISDNDNDTLIEKYAMPAAKSFISGYTGLDAEQIDTHEDLTLAYMVLVNEMYTTRDFTVNKDKLNPTAKTILDMYAVNYL